MKCIYRAMTVGLLSFGLVCLSGCDSNFLDPTNPEAITSNDLWSDQALIDRFLNTLYNDRPGWDYNIFDNITDEARSNYAGNTPNQILVGQWNEVSNPMAFWEYDRVRNANEFLARIDGATVDADVKKTFRGEARFLRAFLYFDMVKRYGAVPLITTPQALTDDLLVSRNTIDECFDFLVSELDQAAADLPETAVRGRATVGSALALKGRVLLFYASPLFNSTGDVTRYQKAADASKVVIGMGYDLYPNHTNLWLDQGTNLESVFEVQYKLPEKVHGLDAMGKPLQIARNDAGQRSPIQELVDAFPMKNGKKITEAGSGYDPAHPYEGRDNRFYAFIGYNGAVVRGYWDGPGKAVTQDTLEIYDGGRDYNANPSTQIYNTITGYYTLKAVNPDNNNYDYQYGSVQPYIEIRFAEVLLNYAEAQNEAAGPDATVYDAVNRVRTRAGITPELTVGSLDKDAMRALIRNERYIEFAFEEKRYWDLRRWKIAESVLNGKQFTGAFITKHPDKTFTYQYIQVDPSPLVFTEKMYLMPIPQTERTKNTNLGQNPGWPQ